MIHAYLFILNIREGNGGHGPNFTRIMNGINKTAGTNITVYHNFHDEVELYRTHVWRCNGICQHRKPFFGWIRRTSNRAPGPNDFWWAKHQETCGGYFHKVSEPEPKRKTTKKQAANNNPAKITNWLNKTGSPNSAYKPNGINFTSMRGAGGSRTIVVKGPNRNIPPTSVVDVGSRNSEETIGGNLKNVVGFKDFANGGECNYFINQIKLSNF